MTIVLREEVRASVDRALQLDPLGDVQAAIASAAQSLGLPVEIVVEALEPVSETTS